ncbi:M20 metallopeptidase family protein [Paenibacillus gorillae]|uniref:M20 metallopeptidase family protein n=1 Tax=Paenibacillus gorillae TaxID=1243662 RepID=UPI0004BC22EA|nr:amidohydrolase [Paenibacillus gorillae]
MPLLEKLHPALEEGYQDVVQWRRYLHQHPELSFQEQHTPLFIAEKLRSYGIEVREAVGGNGVVGTLRGGLPGLTIGLRADFDALPIQDEKDIEYRSTVDGVMHACGHDGHTAALLGTARVLSGIREQLHGNVIFLFQHAEEKPPGGAKFMIEDGCLDGVDYVYGAHLATDMPVGKAGLCEGYMMAAVDAFEIRIIGKGGHGARPEQTVDSIVVGSELVGKLQQIVSRRISPMKQAVVSVGVFQAGTAFNVIASEARIEGTVRSFDPAVRKQIEAEIRLMVQGLCEASHCQYELHYLNGYPALFNPKEETALMRRLIEETNGDDAFIEAEAAMGAEDFSYYLLERPGAYFRVGARNDSEHTQYPHHHPKFDFDEQALLETQKLFLAIIGHYLIKA